MGANLLVTGVTGNIGKEVARQLASRGVAFRAGVHHMEKVGTDLRAKAAEIVPLDFNLPETWPRALDGVKKVFFLSPLTGDTVEIGKRFVASAKGAGVRHVVRLSAMGADAERPLTLARWHRGVETAVEESGLDWTHIRPSVFMQNISNMAAHAIKTGGVFAQPWGQGRVGLVDVRDIAAVVVSALTASGHEGKAYEVTGPEAISGDQIAAALSAVLEKKISYAAISDSDAASYMQSAGMPQWFIDALCELNAAARDGKLSKVTDTVRRIGGKEPYTFREFARDHRAAFA